MPQFVCLLFQDLYLLSTPSAWTGCGTGPMPPSPLPSCTAPQPLQPGVGNPLSTGAKVLRGHSLGAAEQKALLEEQGLLEEQALCPGAELLVGFPECRQRTSTLGAPDTSPEGPGPQHISLGSWTSHLNRFGVAGPLNHARTALGCVAATSPQQGNAAHGWL